MKVSIIIPCFNEQSTIATLLAQVLKVELISWEKEIIVVDDGSTDGTESLLRAVRDPSIKVMCLSKNHGKGYAIREGLKSATGDVVLIQDADLEYNPSEYPILLVPFTNTEVQVVYGSRYMTKERRRPFGTWFITWCTNVLYGSHLTDEPTCYKVFRKSLFASMALTCKRFEFCPEVTAKLLRKGIMIHEVPVHYRPRTHAQGKKLKWFRDGFGALYTLLKFRL